MLDLKLLEKQLDEVLAKETSETMTSWLLDRRLKKYVSALGEGLFVNIPSNEIKMKERLISPNDIRIGNLVTDEFYESFKTIIKVESIDSRGINLEIEDDGNYSECASRWIEPYYRFDTLRAIPISEELLLKIGAVKLDFKEFPSFNLKGLQINFVDGLWIEYVSRVEIKGLHFLQNIFYFRNSEELAVSVLTDR